jgi:integrase
MRKSPENRRAMPFDQWPERDRCAWIAATTQTDDDLLVTNRPALNWRPSSIELFVRYYGIWLDWMKTEGSLDPAVAPEDRVTPERLTTYLKAQRARGVSAKTLVNNAVSLRHMFEALAPDRDWTWLLPMIRKLKTTVVVAKNHSDLPSIRELFEFGMHLMRHAETGPHGSPKQRAIMFRNGLMIAMLAARPMMRRENLARMKIGQNLIREGARYVLRFSDLEMKGRRERSAPLPVILTVPVEHYIDVHRQVLLLGRPEVDRTLFVSMMGLPIYPHAMSNEIGEITEAAFGRRVCAHEFRHATGSSIAKETPERVDIIPSMLGHTDYRTSETYYIFADEHSAFVRLDRALTKLMRDEEVDGKKD